MKVKIDSVAAFDKAMETEYHYRGCLADGCLDGFIVWDPRDVNKFPVRLWAAAPAVVKWYEDCIKRIDADTSAIDELFDFYFNCECQLLRVEPVMA